ncbi:MAG: YggU family protein [Nitrospirae bacterium RBG_16_64_22]|nr:MAG: YggU family protein [Nitrospirae bacterium RBG_16_64_22]
MTDEGGFLRETREGVLLTVHVQPRASRDEIAGLHGDALKIRLKALPASGEANAALLRFLSKRLKTPLAAISMRSGASSRRKTVLVLGIKPEEVRARLQGSSSVNG